MTVERGRAAIRWLGVMPAVALAVAGCATTGSLRESRGEGVTRFYEAEFRELWEAAMNAVQANGLRLDHRDSYERFIAATNVPERAGGDFRDEEIRVEADQGERIAIFVDSVAPGTWGVEVVTRRQFALDPGKTSWAEDIFYIIERDLARRARQVETPSAVPPDSARGGGR